MVNRKRDILPLKEMAGLLELNSGGVRLAKHLDKAK
jgi:hypothetical protein